MWILKSQVKVKKAGPGPVIQRGGLEDEAV
jgi:hypothetical protein